MKKQKGLQTKGVRSFSGYLTSMMPPSSAYTLT